MSDEIQFPDVPFDLDDSLVLLGRQGSEAHGTYVPPSDPDAIDDRDLMGVCVPPVDWTLGLRTWEGAESIKGVWDVVLYDLRKFVRLLCKQNPNVLSLLWLETEDYLKRTPIGDSLIENRLLFLDKNAAHASFVGYAMGQLRRMTHQKFEGYMGAKRKSLVERFGYDCKNAAHLVRLLHMGDEFLRTGALNVRRTWDVSMLREIKGGGWKLEDVKRYAAERTESVHEALRVSPLPDRIDEPAVNQLVVDFLRARTQAPRVVG